jgi:hypothetical protein
MFLMTHNFIDSMGASKSVPQVPQALADAALIDALNRTGFRGGLLA